MSLTLIRPRAEPEQFSSLVKNKFYNIDVKNTHIYYYTIYYFYET